MGQTTLGVGEQPGPDLPLKWIPGKTINAREVLQFRWSTTDWPIGGAKWFVKDGTGAPPISGTISSIPAPGKSATFSIDFAQIAPVTPPEEGIYYLVTIQIGSAALHGGILSTSPAVTIKYVPPPSPVKFDQFVVPLTVVNVTPSFSLQFEGLWCKEESGDAGTDEIYLFAFSFYDDGDGKVKVYSQRVPSTGAIEEIETGKKVKRSDQFFWGILCELSVLIVLVEEDTSNQFDEALENAVLAGAAIKISQEIPAKDMAAAVLQFVPKSIDTTGFNDDEILQGRVGGSWTKEQLLDVLNAPPWTSTPFPAHFETVHKGDGAEYRLYFRVVKE